MKKYPDRLAQHRKGGYFKSRVRTSTVQRERNHAAEFAIDFIALARKGRSPRKSRRSAGPAEPTD